MTVNPDVNYEELARSTEDFNGAQLKAVCVEAGILISFFKLFLFFYRLQELIQLVQAAQSAIRPCINSQNEIKSRL